MKQCLILLIIFTLAELSYLLFNTNIHKKEEIKSQPQVLIITNNWVNRVTGDVFISVINGKTISSKRIN